MAVPSPIKITKNGVEYISNVERTKYTIQELCRAALKDTGKLISKRSRDMAKKRRGLKKSRRPFRAFQYWVRKKEADLQVGIKHDTWYGVKQELGTSNQPKHAILTESTKSNIEEIRKIQGKYLSAIEDENYALGLIDESEEIGSGDE